jgi:1,4-alpha-glucan branching enzyme
MMTVLLLITSGLVSYAQKQNNLIVANDELVLLIDLRSKKADVDSILKRAGIPGNNSLKVLKRDYNAITKEGWKITEQQKHVVQFNKPLNINSEKAPSKPFLLTTTIIKTEGSPGYPAEVLFGINKFTRVTVREIASGATRFFLPGNLDKRKVLLSGSFNMWSTSGGVMLKTDSGWITDVKLQPGIYAYKFIVNGHWTNDTYNQLTEDDGFHDVNSIYYRYNYKFTLKGNAAAAKVTVAGTFNKWKADQINLTKTSNGWQANLYLHDGSFFYRFMVDGKWLADPANAQRVKDAKGNISSVVTLGEVINFRLKGYDNAKKVCIAGGFNNWKTNNLYLKRVNNEWVLPVVLPAKNYGYKFIVDGKWITDPANTCYVVEDGETNSFIAVKANYTFRLKGYENARSVRVAGNFNNWDGEQYTMGRKGDEWVISMKLPTGKNRYKFIVDGTWMIDPGNKLWEPNEFDTGNSVVWIDADIFFKSK